MARELECSVDYQINEAMKQYARQRSYGGSRTPYPAPGRGGEPPQPSSDRGYAAATERPAPMAPPARPPMGGGLPPPPPGRMPPPPGRPAPMPAPPPRGAMPAPPGRGPGAAVAMPQVPRSVPPPGPRSVPPPLPRPPTPLPPGPPPAANGFPSPAAHGSTLSLIYQGERYSITKDRFVIGRGKQSSDLTLKDPNVSRQHAMIEFQNGVYFMVDMGSTNGVEFNGQRIARKQIAEGDVYRICDHDILFTYR
jgi:hypothetical protein